MTDAEIITWSAATGSMGLVVFLAAAEAAYSSSRASVQSLVYLGMYWLYCVMLWLTVRAAQHGDRMAWGLAIAALLTLALQMGLYWLALDFGALSAPYQAGLALLGLLSLSLIAGLLWQRNHQIRQIRHHARSRRDPVTQLYSSILIVQKIVHAQRRQAHTRRDGALMAVQIFEPERLLAQVGHYGLNEIYSRLARRMQRHTGVVNPAGRYYDRCFVVLDTHHRPARGVQPAQADGSDLAQWRAHQGPCRYRRRHGASVRRCQGR